MVMQTMIQFHYIYCFQKVFSLPVVGEKLLTSKTNITTVKSHQLYIKGNMLYEQKL